nr:MAG TPA: hypothetical protein [Caudoviricetes sp.]
MCMYLLFTQEDMSLNIYRLHGNSMLQISAVYGNLALIALHIQNTKSEKE